MVITGLAESTKTNADEIQLEDRKSIDDICSEIEIDRSKILKFYRIKTKSRSENQQPAPLIIETSDNEAKYDILKKSIKFRTTTLDKFKNVYLNKELTAAEREFHAKLRKERNKLNSELSNDPGDGSSRYGLHKGKKFHWGIRNGALVRIIHPN